MLFASYVSIRRSGLAVTDSTSSAAGELPVALCAVQADGAQPLECRVLLALDAPVHFANDKRRVRVRLASAEHADHPSSGAEHTYPPPKLRCGFENFQTLNMSVGFGGFHRGIRQRLQGVRAS